MTIPLSLQKPTLSKNQNLLLPPKIQNQNPKLRMRKKEKLTGYVGKRLTHHLYLSKLTLLSIWQTKERNLVQWWRSQNSWWLARLTSGCTSNPRFSFFNYIELGNSSSLYYRSMLLVTNCFIKFAIYDEKACPFFFLKMFNWMVQWIFLTTQVEKDYI